MQPRHWKAALFALCFIATPHAFGADAGADEYQKRLKVHQTIQPVGQSPFGEQINLYTGETTFAQTDVTFAGTGLPIEITRVLGSQDELGQVATPLGFGHVASAAGIGGWELELPYIETLVAGREIGWQTTTASDTPTTNRCSTNFPAMFNPPERYQGQPRYGGFDIDQWWRGYTLNVPGAGKQQILARAAGDTRKPDSGTYPGVTARYWQVGCLPGTSNGQPGEAFVVVSPEGTTYFMDHLVYGPYRGLQQTLEAGDKPVVFSLERKLARMYASRIVDRFGNTLTYRWEGERVTEMRATDAPGQSDRVVALDWVGDRIHAVRMQPGSAQQRTWRYAYANDGSLSSVTLPDASSWFFVGSPLGQAAGPPIANSGCFNANPPSGSGAPATKGEPRTFTASHPSGLIGTFHFDWHVLAQTSVHSQCVGSGEASESALPYLYKLGLVSKTLSGPGVAASTWRYVYEANHASFDRFCQPPVACKATAYVDVIDPSNAVTRYTHSTRFDALEGQLLRIDHGLADGGALQSEIIEYHTPSGLRPSAFPHGASMGGGNWYKVGDTAPVRKRTILQQGRAFSWEVPETCQPNGERGSGTAACFDTWLRPTRTLRAGSDRRTDDTTYADNTALWVLGQVAQSKNVDTGLVESSATYDATTATPLATYAFGALQATLRHWPDGSLRTSTDANGNPTSFGNYHRGIPQSIAFADGAGRSAVVDALGQLVSTTDEIGAKTCHAFDAMGRLASTTYPSEHSNTLDACDGSWFPASVTYTQSTEDKYGLGAGHWRRQARTGAAITNTYFDARLNPVVEETFDENAVAATLSQTVTRYDALGRVVFRSYPTQGIGHHAAVTQGMRTTYDALGRVVRVEQDSELGVLASTTEYLDQFRTRTTNPRGYQTTTAFRTFDRPTFDAPALILEPEDRVTEFHRDTFGKPTLIRRRNGAATNVLDRHYTYDASQRLCKTIEPETNSTVYAYDAAGQVVQSAGGLLLGSGASASACTADRAAMASSPRRVGRAYDKRGRQTWMGFIDGRGDQSIAYTADGLVGSITTYNDGPGLGAVNNAYEYNRRRLLTREWSGQPGDHNWTLTYGYDGYGALASQAYPAAGPVLGFHPNALGQPTAIRDHAGTVYATGIQYYPNGALKQFVYGNGVLHTMTQNARQLPARVTDANVVDTTYGYDANGNPTTLRDVGAVERYSGNRDLVYDGADRLASAHLHWWLIDEYAYDVRDNISTKRRYFNGTATTHHHLHDASNRLTNLVDAGSGATVEAFGYDEQGNLRNKGGQHFDFDAGNRLRAVVGKETYRYDGHGRRVRAWSPQSGGILAFYGRDGRLAYDENYRRAVRTDYIHLAGSLIATRESSASGVVTRFHHTDALGSPVAVTNHAGAVVERTQWEPFGAAIDKPAYQGVGYAGHVVDGATGLTYMQQRFYDPVVGRFLSVDPVAADTNTAWNFNRYNYAANNPYKFKDPDGRIIETVWDVANVVMGVASLGRNLANGNYAGAGADAGGLLVDAAATFIPGVPGGAGAAIKAARLAENARQGAKAEKAVAEAYGETVAGHRVTLEASTGQRSVADLVTTDKGVVEVKSGSAQLSPGQKAVQADVDAGRSVIPRGENAAKAGLTPNQPTPMKCYSVERC